MGPRYATMIRIFFLAKTSNPLQRVDAQVDKFKAWEGERVKVNYGSSG